MSCSHESYIFMTNHSFFAKILFEAIKILCKFAVGIVLKIYTNMKLLSSIYPGKIKYKVHISISTAILQE